MTLPTRPDGGIDWDRIIFPTEKDISYGWIIGGHKIHRVSVFEFNQMAIAHTRERCAKWHDGEVATLQKRLDADTETALALILEHKQSAAAIRKMED